ncbi:MAG: ABC transporter ATP-binding protein [Salinisphaera sp.]|jgi:branched-chain amino acid transport system ATP-binding protein|nr:ABC transporter ATP-binding protein [Salinisphaera sp.]
MLKVDNISASYGKVRAITDVSLEVREGEVVALLGVNGAGKSTTLKTISGLLRTQDGSIHFQDERIDRLSPEKIARRRIVHVPEGRRLFPGLTVRENLIMGTSNHKVSKVDLNHRLDYVLEIFPDLKPLYSQLSWSLSGGQQQMVAIGRGLMADPVILMLDEPSLGLAPVIVKQVFKTIRDINARGVTVLLVEQNAHLSLQVAHRAYLIETGRIVREDDADTLLHDENLQKEMLGAGF